MTEFVVDSTEDKIISGDARRFEKEVVLAKEDVSVIGFELGMSALEEKDVTEVLLLVDEIKVEEKDSLTLSSAMGELLIYKCLI